MGVEGLMELYKFVQAGGTLITEGSTATIFPEYNLTSGVNVETPAELFARGSILRSVIADRRSPIAYGFDAQLPVYFNQAPILSTGGGGFAGGGRGMPGVSQNVTPMATPLRLSPWDTTGSGARDTSRVARTPGGGGAGGGGGGGGFGGQGAAGPRPRVVVQFPTNPNDLLLSGTIAGGQALAGRAGVIDAPVGRGHVVMFGIRPFWRWQTQGTYFLGFNAILNWNDLDAGTAQPAAARTVGGQ
jgi:hypothetical protein